METRETLGYLKGLIEGLDFDSDKKEAKVLAAVVDVLDNIIMDIEDMTEGLEVLGEHIDLIDEDLAAVEDYLEEDDDFDDCDCCDCCDDEEYEIECPSCGEVFDVDEETILEGAFECPNCGENLEFEIECDCDCDCDDCCED